MCTTERETEPKLRKAKENTMWTQDIITYNGKAYRYAVKHFEESSEFGYKEGRASKIWIERDGKTVFNYDRGLNINAADKDTKAVLQMLLDKFN